MTFAWTPDLAIGSAFIDEQHKQLFAAADSLFSACQLGKERQEVERTMQFLQDYTAKHFADEEALQKKYKYPEQLAHKQLHEGFKKTVRELAEELSRSGPTDDFVSGLYIAIGEWLIDHIKGVDVTLTAYIQE